MHTRQATFEDINVIVKFAMNIALQHHSYNAARFALFPDHHKELKKYFSLELLSNTAVIILLIQNNEAVGYSFVKMESANLESMALKRAWLCDIYVDEKARWAGGGQVLLEASKNAAGELGSSILMLHVAVQNKYAKTFFKKMGFKETMHEMLLTIEA